MLVVYKLKKWEEMEFQSCRMTKEKHLYALTTPLYKSCSAHASAGHISSNKQHQKQIYFFS